MERTISRLVACKVIIPEVDVDYEFDGVYSVEEQLNVWIEYRKDSLNNQKLFDLMASNNFFTVNVSGEMGNHTGLNCICLSPIGEVNINGIIRNAPHMYCGGLIEIYCNYWVENQFVSSMYDDKKWKEMEITFLRSTHFLNIAPDETRTFKTKYGDLIFGIKHITSFDYVYNERKEVLHGLIKFKTDTPFSCQKALRYTSMFQALIFFVSGIHFVTEDTLLSSTTLENEVSVIHGKYGLTGSDVFKEEAMSSMKYFLTDLTLDGVNKWIENWDKGFDKGMCSFLKVNDKAIDKRIINKVKAYDGIYNSLKHEKLYDTEVFQKWKDDILGYVKTNNPFEISEDRINSILDFFQNESLKKKIMNIINDNSSSFSDICKDDISNIANYMTKLRNVDGHLFSTEPIKNETGLSLKQIEKIADRIVFAIVNNKIMCMPEKSRKME